MDSKLEMRIKYQQILLPRIVCIGLILMLVLSACSGGAVQFAPTPLPPDTSPRLYTHPSQAFSLAVPRNWSIYEQNYTTFATVSFALPNATRPDVRVRALRLDETPNDIIAFLQRYQTQIRPDRLRYDEQDRQQLPDGTWRITGALRDAIGVAQPVNTFLQLQGEWLLVADVHVPADVSQQQQIEQAMSTLQINTVSDLEPSSVDVLAQTASTQLEITHVALWTNPQGVFFITGEIANHSEQILEAVPVRASLIAEDGREVAGAVSTTLGHALMPAGFAPFGLRFGQGQPYDAQTFRLEVGGETWQPFALDNITTLPELTWTDSIEIAQDGQLFVSGTVENQSNLRLRDVRAIATIFGEDGRVIGVGYANVDVPILNPNASANFVVLVPEFGGVATQYTVMVQGIRCDDSAC
jgi:hypothetical protein